MATTFTNESLVTTTILNSFTTNITGSPFLTYLLVVLVIVIFAAAFRIPLEWTVIVVFPLLLVIAAFPAYTGSFLALFMVILMYLGLLFAKNYFFR